MPRKTAEKFTGQKTPIRMRRRPLFMYRIGQQMKLEGTGGVVSFHKIKVGRKSIACMALKKSFHYTTPVQIERQFRILNEIRNIPALKSHVPPTVRLIRRNKTNWLLVTDLTRQGRFVIKPPWECQNASEMIDETMRIATHLEKNGYWTEGDVFLVQVNPKTNRGVKVWIVDAEGLERRENTRNKINHFEKLMRMANPKHLKREQM